MATSSGAQGTGTSAGQRPIEFAFDARHKSIVKDVFALEAKRLKRWFARKPKVSLHQLEQALNEGVRESELREMIRAFVNSYYNLPEYGHQFFESLGRLLLEAASREQADGNRQRFLITQSLEVLRLAVQKAPKVLNVTAQGMIVSVTRILGPSYQELHLIEKAVHKEMMAMLNVKRDPNDAASRERIIKAYMQARQFYEALVHIAEYEKIMQAQSRSLHRQKKGEIAFRKASVFQMALEHYHRLSSAGGEEGADRHAELARLSTFVTRFNRDNRRINIVPLKGQDIFSLNKTLRSLVAIANNYYSEATRAEQFPAKHKAYLLMARNAQQFDNPKGAQQILAEGLRVIDQSRMPVRQKLGEKIRMLELLQRIYTDLGQQRKLDETTAEVMRLRKEMRASEMAASA